MSVGAPCHQSTLIKVLVVKITSWPVGEIPSRYLQEGIAEQAHERPFGVFCVNEKPPTEFTGLGGLSLQFYRMWLIAIYTTS